jgi:hypothetical protein
MISILDFYRTMMGFEPVDNLTDEYTNDVYGWASITIASPVGRDCVDVVVAAYKRLYTANDRQRAEIRDEATHDINVALNG